MASAHPTSILSASELLARIVLAQQRCILAQVPGVPAGDDPEPLHRMRTSTRRLRAVLKLSRGVLPRRERRLLNDELAWLARCLGPVRDLDVMIAELPRLLGPVVSGPHDASMTSLTDWLAERRLLARAPLGATLAGPRFEGLLSLLTDASVSPHRRKASLPAATLLRPRLLEQLRLFEAQAGTLSTASSSDDLHRVRILNKRLRYGCELAQPVLPTAVFASTLDIPHDLLGAHQDAVVAGAIIREFQATRPAPAQPILDAWQAALLQQAAGLRLDFFAQLPRVIQVLGDPAHPQEGSLAAALA